MPKRTKHEQWWLEELKDLTTYDPETGDIRWSKTFITGRKIRIKGSIATRGKYYLIINYNKGVIRAHVFIYWLRTGKQAPNDKVIDHINRDPSDNRICNLRLVSHGVNNRNQDPKKANKRNNSTGISGIHYAPIKTPTHPDYGKPYLTGIKINRKQHRRRFTTLEEAIEWRQKILKKYA